MSFEEFARTVAGAYGPDGEAWLARLPDLLRECRERWELVGDGTFPLSFRYVEPVRTRDGAAAVLKLAPDLSAELAALEWFAGHGGVRVLASDPARGAMLLERALPGTPLRDLVADDDVAATAAAAGVMGALWRPAPAAHAFPTVREWGDDLSGGGRAAGLYAELCDSMGEPVVLHGDLHHDNVLRSDTRGWLAIDPKGVVGEREYETGALLRNPKPGLLDLPHPGRILRRRADQLAEALDLDVRRVGGWAYAQAVLSAVWCEQDGQDPAFPLACADLLEPLTR
jgi:streptomycin 6-kinase